MIYQPLNMAVLEQAPAQAAACGGGKQTVGRWLTTSAGAVGASVELGIRFDERVVVQQSCFANQEGK